MAADRGAVLRLILVLEELFTNTVTHGYPAGSEGPIWIAFAQRADLIEVTYEDAGPPFDPLAEAAVGPEDPRARSRNARARPEAPRPHPEDARVRPQDPRVDEGESPGGIGLAIVRGLSTSVRYARVADRNRITLTVPGASAPSPDASA
jgi:serine/threonine-protein kinase RsbW